MSEPTPDQNLHLPSLVIKNFRGIDELTIPRLGRVTLLAGKNGVGKTTVLDAVRIWADRGLTDVFDMVLVDRGDSFATIEDGRTMIIPDRIGLFTNRERDKDLVILVGPRDDPSTTLQIRQIPGPSLPNYTGSLPAHYKGRIELERQFGAYDAVALVTVRLSRSLPEIVVCNTLGPNGPTDDMVGKYLNELALTSYEDRAVEALNLAANTQVERVALIDPEEGIPSTDRRRLMAKVQGKEYRVPLRTLGDGAMRSFAVALSLAKSTDGFLLIDEAENGIHHSIQAKFWNMVLQTAQRNNVQVIATTHSWDCVVGFAEAANELEDVEGLLVRIERVPVGLRAITYDEARLATVSRSNIEVR